jgi:hypothetical protein
MALIKGVRKILKNEFPASPEWFADFLSILNPFIETTINALRNKLTLKENFYGDIKEVEFVHGVEQSIKFTVEEYQGILILTSPTNESDDYAIAGFKTRILDTKQLGVKIYFRGAGTITGKVKFIILG